jgi:hypothetical protein
MKCGVSNYLCDGGGRGKGGVGLVFVRFWLIMFIFEKRKGAWVFFTFCVTFV